ncbi:glycosyltransferase [Sorlinia euscelidii]|uniref:glycosyltransferase n=1 Tax=Sorlinia euscelidii TaxID=3081148 RepID=UPI00374E1B3D
MTFSLKDGASHIAEAPLPRASQSPVIYILLSLYNGAAYLPDQLESFLRQDLRSWRLLWRDDGSEDGSRALMRAFSAKCAAGQCMEVSLSPRRIGVRRSYELLLEHVPDNGYVAFADQDDVWLDDKLSRAFDALKTSRKPALYCARQFIVDENLGHRRLSPRLPAGKSLHLAAALTQNLAVGHTILLNPAAIALIKKSVVPEDVLLDWWSYLIVALFDGDIMTDNRPASLYRQHRQNTVGATAHLPIRAYRAMRRGPAVFMRRFAGNVASLRQVASASPSSLMSEHASKARHLPAQQYCAFLDEIEEALRASPLARIKLLSRHRALHRQGRLEHIVFCLWFILRRASQSPIRVKEVTRRYDQTRALTPKLMPDKASTERH